MGDNLYKFPQIDSANSLPRDASIICLGGGKGRIAAAFSLYSSGIGQELMFIGVGKKSTAASLLKIHAPDLKIPEEKLATIQVETESKNTFENAVAVGKFLEKNPNLNKLILVTSAYHMRRAKYLVEQEARRKIEITLYNPPNEGIEEKTWWHSLIGIQVTVVEYLKFLMATEVYPRLSGSSSSGVPH